MLKDLINLNFENYTFFFCINLSIIESEDIEITLKKEIKKRFLYFDAESTKKLFQKKSFKLSELQSALAEDIKKIPITELFKDRENEIYYMKNTIDRNFHSSQYTDLAYVYFIYDEFYKKYCGKPLNRLMLHDYVMQLNNQYNNLKDDDDIDSLLLDMHTFQDTVRGAIRKRREDSEFKKYKEFDLTVERMQKF